MLVFRSSKELFNAMKADSSEDKKSKKQGDIKISEVDSRRSACAMGK